jgi:hypothetical protein
MYSEYNPNLHHHENCKSHGNAVAWSTAAHEQNITVEWLILLFHVLEVPGSNIGPESGYSDRPLVALS